MQFMLTEQRISLNITMSSRSGQYDIDYPQLERNPKHHDKPLQKTARSLD